MRKSALPSSFRLTGKYKAFFLAIGFSAFLFSGCKKEIETIQPQPTEASPAVEAVSQSLKPKLEKYRVVWPNEETERKKPVSIDLLKLDPQYRNMVLRALKATEAPCDDNTRLQQWLQDQLTNWSSANIVNALNTGMIDVPTYHALLFENRSFGQYFGVRGEYTLRIWLSFLKLKHFWDIDSRNMVLAGLHGTMLRNRLKVYNTYNLMYGLESEDAIYLTDVVAKLLQTTPQYRNGDHPVFSFNAYSQPSVVFPPLGVLPAKIVIGDGMLEGFKAIGYGDVAPQAILAHEYGHQVQFYNGEFGEEGSPESTRRIELMADAYSAYYLSHVRGEFMRWGRVRQFLQVFFNIGDCQTSSLGHHGTPLQRMAAAEWGYQIAKNAERQGRVLPGKVFAGMFDAALPGILAR